MTRHPNILAPRYLNNFHRWLCEGIFWVRLTFKPLNKADCLPWCEQALSIQLKTSRKRLTSLKEEGNLPVDCLKSWTATLPRVSSLLAYSAYFGLASFHNRMSQFLKIKLYMHILLVLFLWRALTNRAGDIFGSSTTRNNYNSTLKGRTIT